MLGRKTFEISTKKGNFDRPTQRHNHSNGTHLPYYVFLPFLSYIATAGLQARFAKRKCQFRCVLRDGFENAKVWYPIKPRDVVSTKSLFGLCISLFSICSFFSIYQTARQCVAPTYMCVSCCYRNQTIGSWPLSIRWSSAFSFVRKRRKQKNRIHRSSADKRIRTKEIIVVHIGRRIISEIARVVHAISKLPLSYMWAMAILTPRGRNWPKIKEPTRTRENGKMKFLKRRFFARSAVAHSRAFVCV